MELVKFFEYWTKPFTFPSMKLLSSRKDDCNFNKQPLINHFYSFLSLYLAVFCRFWLDLSHLILNLFQIRDYKICQICQNGINSTITIHIFILT